MEVLQEVPNSDTFIPLSEHQSATPASFYSGPPVLHYHSGRCKVVILERDLNQSPALTVLARQAQHTSAVAETVTNGNGNHGQEDDESETHRILDGVDIWVTSDKLFLYSTAAATGLSIPYPSISLHAIQTLPQPTSGEQQGLYMQLISSALNASEDEEPESISLTIIPPAAQQEAAESHLSSEEQRQPPAAALFTALSNCSNLHPDPIEEDGADLQDSMLFQAGMIAPGNASGGLPPPIPGSGGWITAENMSQFFDEDGNWIGGEEGEEEHLGPSAGTVRLREEDPGPDEEESDNTKWQRTS